MWKLWALAILLNFNPWNNSVWCESVVNCGGTFSGYQYTINSPNYPAKYPANQDCTYYLHGTRQARCEQEFHLQFLDLNIRATEKCQQDFLQIGNANIYCGKSAGLRIFKGDNNVLKIHFHSGPDVGAKGFRILVTTLPCIDTQKKQNVNLTHREVASRQITPKTELAKNSFNDGKNEKNSILEEKTKSLSNHKQIETLSPIYRSWVKFPENENRSKNFSNSPSPRKLGPSTYLFLPPTSNIEKTSHTPTKPQFSRNFTNSQLLGTNFSLPILPSVPFRKAELPSDLKNRLRDRNSQLNVPGSKFGNGNQIGFGIGSGASSGNFPGTGSGIGFVPGSENGAGPTFNFGTITPSNSGENGPGTGSGTIPGVDCFDSGSGIANNPGIGSNNGWGTSSGSVPEIGSNNFWGTSSGYLPGVETSNGWGTTSGNVPGTGTNHAWETGSENLPGTGANNGWGTSSGNVPGTGSNSFWGTNSGNLPGTGANNGWGTSSGNVPGIECNHGLETSSGSAPGSGSNNFLGTSSGYLPGLGASNGWGTGSGNSPGTGSESGVSPPGLSHSGAEIDSKIGFVSNTGVGYNGPELVPEIGPGIYPGNGLGSSSGIGFYGQGNQVEIGSGLLPGTGSGFVPGTGSGIFPGVGSGIGSGSVPGPVPGVGAGFFPGTGSGIGPNYPAWSRPVFECCGPKFPSQRSLIASPGFPNLIYSATPFECGYTIYKSSFASCRLRLNLKFFNFGNEEPFCRDGFLSIAGRRICGCKTGLSLVFPFGNFRALAIDVRYRGFPKSKFNGFLIETVQENCDGFYSRFRDRKDSAVNETLEGELRREDGALGNFSGSIVSHARSKREGYVYVKPSVTGHANLNVHSALGRSERLFWNSCQSRVFLDWILAAKEAFITGARCPGSKSSRGLITVNPVTGAWNGFPGICEEIAAVEGVISSPFYPNHYPNFLRKCYRFYRAPGFCQLELSVLDFSLETSFGCAKDYLMFSGQNKRYCGDSLLGTTTVFDLSRSKFAEIYFVTDATGNERGFTAGFVQKTC